MGELWIEWEKDEVRSKIEAKINELPSKALGLVDDMAEVTEVYMEDEAPVKFGDLQNSIVTETLSDLERWIGPTVAHAIYVIKGTRPHEILASGWIASEYQGVKSYGRVSTSTITVMGQTMSTGKQALWWAGADHPVYKVDHPGTQPNDFVTRSKERSEGRHSEQVQDFLGWLTE